MRIGLNGQIVVDAGTGVARYARNMIEALLRIPSVHSFVLFGGTANSIDVPASVTVAKTGSWVNTAWKRIAWEQVILPAKLKSFGIDLMYYPDHTAPLFVKPCPLVITVHDISFLAVPETAGHGRRVYKSATIRRSIALADVVIADSQATKDECCRLLGVDAEKIIVVHNGVGFLMRKVTNDTELERARVKYKIESPFILHVGTVEARKNLSRLVQAFADLKKRAKISHRLVLAGGRGFGYEEIVQTARSSGFNDQIAFLGFVADQDLPALYSLADLMVYPSLYEGFGFPPLEAMACGCPVVASNSTSLPEVIGNAGLMVNPRDTHGLAVAMVRVLTDRNLRKQLIARGHQRAKKFTWESSASKLSSVFDTL